MSANATATKFADVTAIVYELDSDSIDGSVSIRVTPETDRVAGLVEIPEMDVTFPELRKLIQFLIELDANHGSAKS